MSCAIVAHRILTKVAHFYCILPRGILCRKKWLIILYEGPDELRIGMSRKRKRADPLMGAT